MLEQIAVNIEEILYMSNISDNYFSFMAKIEKNPFLPTTFEVWIEEKEGNFILERNNILLKLSNKDLDEINKHITEKDITIKNKIDIEKISYVQKNKIPYYEINTNIKDNEYYIEEIPEFLLEENHYFYENDTIEFKIRQYFYQHKISIDSFINIASKKLHIKKTNTQKICEELNKQNNLINFSFLGLMHKIQYSKESHGININKNDFEGTVKVIENSCGVQDMFFSLDSKNNFIINSVYMKYNLPNYIFYYDLNDFINSVSDLKENIPLFYDILTYHQRKHNITNF